MKQVKLVVVIPVGPGTKTAFLLDTLESIKYYCHPSHAIVLVNDSQKTLPSEISKFGIDEIKTPRSMGKQAGLYFSLCFGMRYAFEKYAFQVLLRMDDDALITGNKPELDAAAYFKKQPAIGLLGSYTRAWDQSARSFDVPAQLLRRELTWYWRVFKSLRRLTNINLVPIVKQALANGYDYGEHVLGGAYFMSYALVKSLATQNLLPSARFRASALEEDHIFGLLTKAVGFEMGDFVTGNYPMCLKLKGMPTSPKKVIALKKKVIHSTRYYKTMDEAKIRQIFKKARV